jgi:hypothetical protein
LIWKKVDVWFLINVLQIGVSKREIFHSGFIHNLAKKGERLMQIVGFITSM